MDKRNWKDFARLVVPNVSKHEHERSDFPLIIRRKHQDYIESMIGNVVYFRDGNKTATWVDPINLRVIIKRSPKETQPADPFIIATLINRLRDPYTQRSE